MEKNASNEIVMNNEKDLLNALNSFDKDKDIDNQCFEEIIWPKGDPWLNVSNFLDKMLKS